MKYRSQKETNFSEIKRCLEEIYQTNKNCISIETCCSPIAGEFLGNAIKIKSESLEAEMSINYFEFNQKGILTSQDKQALDFLREQYPLPLNFIDRFIEFLSLAPYNDKKYWKKIA